MNKGLFLTGSSVAAILLTGCSTAKNGSTQGVVSPALAAEAQPALREEMEKRCAEIMAAGGLAVVGAAESKSLDLALNKAKVNGRIELTRRLNARVEALAKAFSEETGVAYESLLLSGFNNTTRTLAGQIASRVAQRLNYERTGNTFTAYALMILDPKAIVDELANEKELYDRLQLTKVFEVFNQEIKTYNAFRSEKK